MPEKDLSSVFHTRLNLSILSLWQLCNILLKNSPDRMQRFPQNAKHLRDHYTLRLGVFISFHLTLLILCLF